MNIFDARNSGIKNGQLYYTFNDNVQRKIFPYTLDSFLKQIQPMKIFKIGSDDDLNEMLEDKTQTQPFNLLWDMTTFHLGRIPNYKEFINQYIKTYCEYTQDNLLKYKDCYENTPFTFTYKALAVRIYKIYFSFVREYHLYLRLTHAGLNTFIDRRDDYKERIDIGVIKDNILYILDTSLNSKRSNEFEKNKLTIRRNNALDESSARLAFKYNCKYFVRIPLKATPFRDNKNYNTQSVGRFDLYTDWYIDLLIFYINNVPINKNINLDNNFFIDYHNKEESTQVYF